MCLSHSQHFLRYNIEVYLPSTVSLRNIQWIDTRKLLTQTKADLDYCTSHQEQQENISTKTGYSRAMYRLDRPSLTSQIYNDIMLHHECMEFNNCSFVNSHHVIKELCPNLKEGAIQT